MPARLSAFVIWALVAAGLVFWGYRLWVRPMVPPANVQTVGESAGGRGDLTRLLGAAPAASANLAPQPAAQSTRFHLLGVLAPRSGASAAQASPVGVALIAVDGKPARPYAVGARVDAELVLQSIARRSASIGPAQGGASFVLELPPPAPPSTGTLPRAMAGGEPARANVPRPLPVQPAAPPTVPPIAPNPLQAPTDEPSDDEQPAVPTNRGSGSNATRR